MAATGDYDSTGSSTTDSASESDSLEGHRPWPSGVLTPGHPSRSFTGHLEQVHP